MHTLSYEIAISISSPHEIVWVNGPFKGSTHDLTIAKSNIIHQMLPGEKALGDLGYIGHHNFVCPYKPARSQEQKLFNRNHYAIRQSIERLNKRLKLFNCLKTKWRQSFELHKCAFYLITYITQIVITNYEPLTK